MAKPKPKSDTRSLRKIRRVASRRLEAFPPEPGPGCVAELEKRRKGKDRDEIVDAAIHKPVLSEALQPCRAGERRRAELHLKRLRSQVKYRGRRRTFELGVDPQVVIPGDTEMTSMEKERRKHGAFMG